MFDKSQTPHVQSRNLAAWFDLSQNTVSDKSRTIRDIIKIRQLDPKWTLPSRIDQKPLVWLVLVDGFIIDIRDAPYELQIEAFNTAVIPYLPHNKKY